MCSQTCIFIGDQSLYGQQTITPAFPLISDYIHFFLTLGGNGFVTIRQNRSPDHRAVIRGSNPAKIRRPSADLAPILDSPGCDPANLTRS